MNTKKSTNLLNALERKYFEEIYQCLNNYHKWEMRNIFYEGTVEYEEFKITPLRFYAKDKNTRLSVAAHESGHAIVMIATHGSVDTAVIDIKNDPEGRIGCVVNQVNKDAKEFRSIKQAGLPLIPLIKIDTLIQAGGFVGESFVGKQTGSNHEKFLVFCRCRYLDDRDGVAPLTNWRHYVEWCNRIILNNENLFWRIIDDLLENSELTDPVKILLHEKVIKEIPESLLN